VRRRPCKHVRRVRTKKGKRRVLVNRKIKKRPKKRNFGSRGETVTEGRPARSLPIGAEDIRVVESAGDASADRLEELNEGIAELRQKLISVSDNAAEREKMKEFMETEQLLKQEQRREDENRRSISHYNKLKVSAEIKARTAKQRASQFNKDAERAIRMESLDSRDQDSLSEFSDGMGELQERLAVFALKSNELKRLQQQVKTKKEFLAAQAANKAYRKLGSALQREDEILTAKVNKAGFSFKPLNINIPKFSFNMNIPGF